MRNLFLPLVILLSLLTGCTSTSNKAKALEDYRIPTEPAVESSVAAPAALSSEPPANCPVTTNAFAFEAPEPFSPNAPWDTFFWFGSDNLWTALRDDGVWAGLPHNPEGYTQKIMWWSSLYSLPDELEPELVVTGQRLDAEAPPLKFYGATNAMADDIGEAMLTGADFPTLVVGK